MPSVPGALGIHIEGPFLSPARKGVHDPQLFRPIEQEDIALITSLKRGRTLMTLAPECVPAEIVARLAEAGVILSAGHTAASYEPVRRRAGRGAHRIHPSFQCDAAACRARAGAGRRRHG